MGHTVFRKAIHTNLYLNNLRHHHLAYKISVMFRLRERAKRIVDEEHLKGEMMAILQQVFIQNGYEPKEVDQLLTQKGKKTSP